MKELSKRHMENQIGVTRGTEPDRTEYSDSAGDF